MVPPGCQHRRWRREGVTVQSGLMVQPLPILTQAQLEGRACWRCGDESSPLRPGGAYGDQSPLVFECIATTDCRTRVFRLDRLKALNEVARRRQEGARG